MFRMAWKEFTSKQMYILSVKGRTTSRITSLTGYIHYTLLTSIHENTQYTTKCMLHLNYMQITAKRTICGGNVFLEWVYIFDQFLSDIIASFSSSLCPSSILLRILQPLFSSGPRTISTSSLCSSTICWHAANSMNFSFTNICFCHSICWLLSSKHHISFITIIFVLPSCWLLLCGEPNYFFLVVVIFAK